MAKRMTQEDKDMILKLYSEGKNTVEISEIIGKDNSTIGRFLKSQDLKARNNKKSFSPSDILEIINLYESGMGTEEIGEKFSVTGNTIASKMREHGAVLRRGGMPHKINVHDYFETIDSERKAYFLGLIISDGGIIDDGRAGRSKALSFTLKSEDLYILQEFEKELGVKTLTSKINSRGEAYLRFSSEKLTDDLEKYGVVLRKSKIAYLPNVREDLIPHLIRGIFDGDGTVHLYKKNTLRFGFYGTNKICNQIKEYLVNKIGISDNKVFDKEGVSFITFTKKKDIKNFSELIYKNATVYLHRKKSYFDKWNEEHANI